MELTLDGLIYIYIYIYIYIIEIISNVRIDKLNLMIDNIN